MIDRKKIAEKLRKIAEDCAFSGSIAVNKTNATLYAAADELDPPEPKPMLAEAKVGDLCQRRDGKWVQVDSYSNDRPCPVMCKSDIGGQDCFTLDGRNHNAINDSKDIIATEPLAPKGTAEWAWQMLKLGKPVTNKRVFIAGGHIKDTDSGKYHFVHMWGYSGWQIYEPEPEPKFAVGDWVEIEVSGVLSQQQATSGVFADSIKCGGVEFYANGNPVMQPLNARIIRKLSGCEVKVRVALEGTVRKSQLNGCFVLDTPMPGNDVHTIRLVELDPNTAELVKALLKAQEEK